MNPNKHIRAFRAAVALAAAQSLIMIPAARASCWECDAQYDEDMSACNDALDSAQFSCAEQPEPAQNQCYADATYAFYECAADAGSSCTCC